MCWNNYASDRPCEVVTVLSVNTADHKETQHSTASIPEPISVCQMEQGHNDLFNEFKLEMPYINLELVTH